MILLFALAFLQATTFALSSRARNRGHMTYNFIATCIGNVAWFLCFREAFMLQWALSCLPSYVLGTGLGSVCGTKLSMFIEQRLFASADGHLKEVKDG